MMSRPPADITGRRSGLLVAVKMIRDNDDRIKWLCDCDCGGVSVRTTHDIVHKIATNCGCLNPNKYVDLTGRHFGHMEVLGRAENSPTNAKRWWCECGNCGNIVSRDGSTLKQGKITHCGCLNAKAGRKASDPAGAPTKQENKTIIEAEPWLFGDNEPPKWTDPREHLPDEGKEVMIQYEMDESGPEHVALATMYLNNDWEPEWYEEGEDNFIIPNAHVLFWKSRVPEL